MSLLDPLQPDTKIAIAQAFWNSKANDGFAAYWPHFRDECERALQNKGQYTLARTHQDILDITASLKKDLSREAIRDILLPKFTKQHHDKVALMDRSIDLSASLLLMMDFGHIQHGFSRRHRLQWTDGSLRDCVRKGFEKAVELNNISVKLERSFTALSLVRIAGLEIVPTTNLLDHLRLIEDDKKLCIFHHASFLKSQSQDSLIPESVVKETIATLALLFPQSDKNLRKWFKGLKSPLSLDTELVRCGQLKTDHRRIERFNHWHDRLIILKQVFDEATPQTLSQWWYDRRNSVQWWTFWIAVIVLVWTLITGFIQSITGIMQVYAAFNVSSGV